MTGKSLCEMRRCVYNSTQMLWGKFNIYELPFSSAHFMQCLFSRTLSWFSLLFDHVFWRVWSWDKILSGMPQTAAVLSITNMMNPHLFFFFALSISFLLVAHALPCGKPVCLSPCACKGIIYHLCLRRLAFTKHMTGKSLCEMRGCLYISTQMYQGQSVECVGHVGNLNTRPESDNCIHCPANKVTQHAWGILSLHWLM